MSRTSVQLGPRRAVGEGEGARPDGAVRRRPAPSGVGEHGPELLPLDAGEQYRFAFSMEACIGCHSCEVACAEQNDTPLDVAWRRVGELEAGSFPETRRLHVSMACNHCVEPTCLSGCPTEAYVKLPNGIVEHHADDCIGCQYCIWNCPYEVPVFDAARRIVSKCDMCRPRLDAGQLPACVLACPTSAITVEKVDVEAWRADHTEADAPGLPPADITLSTTRIVSPPELPADAVAAADHHRLEPEDPHWPLVALTFLTQVSLGTVAATVATQGLHALRGRPALAGGALAAFLAGGVALAASLLHLGRPTHALKALRNLRTSWLSREVALFSLFAAASFAYALAWVAPPTWPLPTPSTALGLLATALGAAGVYASGRLYLVPARPVWNSSRTLVAFFATALATGPLVTLAFLDRSRLHSAWIASLLAAAAAGTVCQLAVQAHLLATVSRHGDRQHRGTQRLLTERFRGLLQARVAAAAAALVLLAWTPTVPLSGAAATGRIVTALAVTVFGELAGRYLFYVTAVPYRVAGSFFGGRA